MRFKVNDRVKIKNKYDYVVATGTIININDYRPPSKKYAIDIDGFEYDYMFVSEDSLEKIGGYVND